MAILTKRFSKMANGRKRFILTDTLGLIMGILIVAANVGERAGAEKLFEQGWGKYPRLKKVLANQGFDGENMCQESNNCLDSCLK